MPRMYLSARARLGLALAGASVVSMVFYLYGAWKNGSWEFSYLAWNLALAWLPLAFALWLQDVLRTRLWSGWYPLLVTLLWLMFLPNTFYMITDFIHLQDVVRADIVYDVVMFFSFITVSVLLGCISLYVVHLELLKRFSRRASAIVVGGVLLLTSFAMYIGRDLRWNSWDIIFNPASLLFDVSDRVLNPTAHPQVVTTTLSFFIFLGTIYVLACCSMRAARQQKAD